MATDFNLDVRRCTVVKIQSPESLDTLSTLPKFKNLNAKVDTNRWSSATHSQSVGDSSFNDNQATIPSPHSTLTKPKALNNPVKDCSLADQKLNSSELLSPESLRNSFVDNFKRSETFSKKFKDYKDTDSDVIHDSRNSRCIFLSQIHLIFHISITICLIGYEGYDTNIKDLVSHQIIIITYFAYLLVLSIVFMLLLRYFCVFNDEIGLKAIRSEQISILFGAAFLGMIQLIKLAIDIFECIHTELVIMPVLEFVFTLFLNHYLLTQVIDDKHLGLRNIVISHLLSTQVSLWLFSFESKSEQCSFSDHNCTSDELDVSLRESILPKSISNLMVPIIHNYKLLTIFILITIWFTNNQSKISFIRAKLFDEEALKTAFLSGKSSTLRGFLFGFGLLLFSIVVVLFEEKDILKITHISIQVIFGLVLTIGLLVIRRKKKYLNYKYKLNFLDYHFVVYITLLAGYVYGLSQMIFSSSMDVSNICEILDGLTLVIQMSLQSFIIRLQRRKFVVMNQFFVVSIFSNLSLWVLEIYDISDKLFFNTITDSAIILSIFVSLNRFYSALVFYQFFKSN